MNDPVFAALIGVSFVAVILAFVWQRRRIAQIRDEYANDPDVVVGDSSWSLTMQTRSPLRSVSCVQAGGGRNDPARWQLSSSVQLQGGVSLNISKEGALGKLREVIGVKDIHVGDDNFDRAFTIRGNNDEQIAQLLQDGATQQAVYDLFAANVWSFNINENGAVVCRAPRGMLNGEQPKKLLLLVVALCDALEGKPAGSYGDPRATASRY